MGNFQNPYANIGIIDNGQGDYGSSSTPGSCHTVHTRIGEMDSCSGGQLQKIPPGECKSVRLGGFGSVTARSVSYEITVDTNVSDIIMLKYACVLYNPGELPSSQPYFRLEILDANTCMNRMTAARS